MTETLNLLKIMDKKLVKEIEEKSFLAVLKKCSFKAVAWVKITSK